MTNKRCSRASGNIAWIQSLLRNRKKIKGSFKFDFHCKEDNLGLGIIEVRPYKLVMRTIHEISCDAYWIQLSSPKKSIKRSLIYATLYKINYKCPAMKLIHLLRLLSKMLALNLYHRLQIKVVQTIKAKLLFWKFNILFFVMKLKKSLTSI